MDEALDRPEPPRMAAAMVWVLAGSLFVVAVASAVLARTAAQDRAALIDRLTWSSALGEMAAGDADATALVATQWPGMRDATGPVAAPAVVAVGVRAARGAPVPPARVAAAIGALHDEQAELAQDLTESWDQLLVTAGSALILASLTAALLVVANRRRAFLMEERRRLTFTATHDSLTGLWNRASVLDALSRENARSRRQRQPFGVLMLDLDGFKNLNDSFGHLTGDEVLREVARRMQDALRPYDTVGRYGGEEFLVVLPGCDHERAALLAERLRAAVADRPVDAGDRRVDVTVSAGVTAMDGVVEPLTLVRKADDALLAAKRAGGNLAVVATPSPQ